MPEVFGFDCYSPREIAERVENVGVTKARLPLISMVALGILAGGFIGLGAMFFTLVQSDAGLSFAVARVLGGVVFSLGLMLVLIAGAEFLMVLYSVIAIWMHPKRPQDRLPCSHCTVNCPSHEGSSTSPPNHENRQIIPSFFWWPCGRRRQHVNHAIPYHGGRKNTGHL